MQHHLRIENVKSCRKKWHCHECMRPIDVGESLRKDIVAYDGCIVTHITCETCLAFLRHISEEDEKDYYYCDELLLADHDEYEQFVVEWYLLGKD